MKIDHKPVRVAIVSASLSRAAGGILPIMQNHAKELLKLGVEVSVHGVSDDFNEVDRSGWGEVPLYFSKSFGSKRLAFAPGLGRTISAADPDIIHQHGI